MLKNKHYNCFGFYCVCEKFSPACEENYERGHYRGAPIECNLNFNLIRNEAKDNFYNCLYKLLTTTWRRPMKPKSRNCDRVVVLVQVARKS